VPESPPIEDPSLPSVSHPSCVLRGVCPVQGNPDLQPREKRREGRPLAMPARLVPITIRIMFSIRHLISPGRITREPQTSRTCGCHGKSHQKHMQQSSLFLARQIPMPDKKSVTGTILYAAHGPRSTVSNAVIAEAIFTLPPEMSPHLAHQVPGPSFQSLPVRKNRGIAPSAPPPSTAENEIGRESTIRLKPTTKDKKTPPPRHGSRFPRRVVCMPTQLISRRVSL